MIYKAHRGEEHPCPQLKYCIRRSKRRNEVWSGLWSDSPRIELSPMRYKLRFKIRYCCGGKREVWFWYVVGQPLNRTLVPVFSCALLNITNRLRNFRRVIRIIYLEKVKVVLVVVDVQDLAKQVPVAEVMIQVQHPLFEAKVLVQPPFQRSIGERDRQRSILLVIQ